MPSSTWVESKKKTEQVKKSKAVIDWIKENRETFWGGIGIFAAVVLFIVFFSANYSKVQKNAWQSLFMAQQNAYGGNIEQALKMTGDIAKNYKRSSAYPFAVMMEGDIYFSQGKYEEAEKSYSMAVKKAGKELVPVLLFDIAKTYEARRNWDETLKAYESFLKKYPDHYTAPEVHTNLAIAYARAGQNDKAKEAFEKIMVMYPDSVWAEQAKKTLNPSVSENVKESKANAKKAK